AIAVPKHELRGADLDVWRQRGEFVLCLLPDKFEQIDVLLLAFHRVCLLAAGARPQRRRQFLDRLGRSEYLPTPGEIRQARGDRDGIAKDVVAFLEHRPVVESNMNRERRTACGPL